VKIGGEDGSFKKGSEGPSAGGWVKGTKGGIGTRKKRWLHGPWGTSVKGGGGKKEGEEGKESTVGG